MSLAVPAYFHPVREAAEWARLRDAGPDVAVVVINPGTGPGHGDPVYRAGALGTVGLVAGYVDTAYSDRPLTEVLGEVDAYRRWYGVTAVFADRATSDPAHLSYYRELARRVPGPLLLNPGVRPDPAYLEIADAVVTFEGTWASHQALEGPDPQGRARTWHLVHGVPTPEQPAVRQRATLLGAALSYATERVEPNPWDALPGSWVTR